MAFISISYDEGSNKPDLGYKSVNVCYGDNKKKIFDSGDFVKDWYYMRKFLITEISNIESYFSYSSSVDHFIMDSAKFDSAYLIVNDDITELKYPSNIPVIKNTKNNTKEEQQKFLQYLVEDNDIDENGIEFFVPENTKPTWAELRKMCGDKPVKKVSKPKTIKPLSDEQIEKLQKSMVSRLKGGFTTALPVSDEKLLTRLIASYKELRNKQI